MAEHKNERFKEVLEDNAADPNLPTDKEEAFASQEHQPYETNTWHPVFWQIAIRRAGSNN